MDSIIAFSSFKRVGLVRADGTDECYPDLGALIEPGESQVAADAARPEKQQGWQWGPVLPDGSGMVVSSFEETAMDRLVVGDFRTRVWCLLFESGRLVPILEGNRPSEYTTYGASLPDGSGCIAAAIIDGEQRLYRTRGDLFSADLVYEPLTGPREGFHYGIDVAPDGSCLACHVTGGKAPSDGTRRKRPPYPSYSIHRIDLETGRRTVLYGDDEHLYFAPVFDPSGRRIAFLDCEHRADPAHFWADLCVTPADRSDSAVQPAPRLTEGRRHWFGTTHGPAEHRGGGSNMTSWTPDGRYITYTRSMPGSHPDCYYDESRPDHQENVFRPENARGGTQLCLLSPDTGDVVELTPHEEGRWDFRATLEPESGRIAFAGYRIGEAVELRTADPDGANQVVITTGFAGHGADHPRWVPETVLDAVPRDTE